MARTWRSPSVSPKMLKRFLDDLKHLDKNKRESQDQLFASRLLYEMIIDHNYAKELDFPFTLFL